MRLIDAAEMYGEAQVALADHVRENRGALDVHLTADDLENLDREFPPPSKKMPLEML